MTMKRYLLAAVALTITAPTLAAQAPDRSHPPELGPPPTLSLPAIIDHTLPNGLRVIYMAKQSVPLVQINIVIKTGSVMDPDDRLGLASVTAAMLDEGAGGRNALDFSEAIDFLGASIRVSGGLHSTTISLHSPVAQLDAAMELLADVVMRPAFSAEELDRLRRQRLCESGPKA